MKNKDSKAKTKRPLFMLNSLIVWDVILFAVFIWANWVNFTDESGWSGLLTIPILLLVFVMLITTAIGFVVLAAKAPKKSSERAYLFLGAAVSLLPIACTLMYAVISNSLAQAYRRRSETPITFQEAKQLVTTCRVETIYRHNGGQMQLNDKVPVMPGEATKLEYRIFDVKYFDELLALTRQKEVQDKCGFVPSYDIERSRKSPTTEWITEQEAMDVLGECRPSTSLTTDLRYASGVPRDEPGATGIAMRLEPEVWNDEFRSEIILVRVSDDARTALKEKYDACY